MEARLSKLPMAKPIHPSIHVGLTGGGAYPTAVYGAILLRICSQLVKATTNYQQGQVWYIYPYEKKPLPASFPFLWPTLSHLKARAPCSPSKKNLLEITASVRYHPALLYREDAGLRKKKKSRSGSNVEREIFIGFVWFRLWLLSLQTNPLRLDSKGERVHLQAVTRWEHP